MVKSHLVKVIYNAVSKTLLYHCKNPEKPKFFLLRPKGIPIVNIGGTSIHSGLAVKVTWFKQIALRNRLSKVKLLIIDKLSMVSSDLWTDIDSRLGEMLIMIPEKAFAF